MEFDPQQLKIAFDMLRSAIGFARDSKDLLPKPKQDDLERSLGAAESVSQLAEAQMAKALGYNLCQFTYPPQIMLSKGYSGDRFNPYEVFECPKCKKILPPNAEPMPDHFEVE